MAKQQHREKMQSFSVSVTVSGLLAGFSFTGMVAVIALDSQATGTTVSFFSFLIAIFLFLASAIGGWATLEWLSETKTEAYEGKIFHIGAIWGFLSGLLAFVIGVVATASLYSCNAAILAGILSVLMVAFFLVSAAEVSNGKPTT